MRYEVFYFLSRRTFSTNGNELNSVERLAVKAVTLINMAVIVAVSLEVLLDSNTTIIESLLRKKTMQIKNKDNVSNPYALLISFLLCVFLKLL